MAKAKKSAFTDKGLEWLESKVREIEAYCDSTPISQLEDRIVGGKLMATIEEQIKARRESLKDCVLLKESIKKLKEAEEIKKVAVRGDAELSPLEMGAV
jgi:hypothetical protein